MGGVPGFRKRSTLAFCKFLAMFMTKINVSHPARQKKIYGKIRKSFIGHGSPVRTKLGSGKNGAVL